MPLKLGVWKMNVNGNETPLIIEAVDSSGPVTGTLNSRFIDGLWDETSQTIIFGLFAVDVNGVIIQSIAPQIYKGYLIKTPFAAQPGQDVVWTLTGFVQTVDISSANSFGGNARRREFGWFAQITEVF